MDFTNYQPTLYMPFTWDAVWAIAKGLHSVLYEKKTIANASILCKNANDRKILYDELIQHVEFEGATGTVLFLNETKKILMVRLPMEKVTVMEIVLNGKYMFIRQMGLKYTEMLVTIDFSLSGLEYM